MNFDLNLNFSGSLRIVIIFEVCFVAELEGFLKLSKSKLFEHLIQAEKAFWSFFNKIGVF